MQIKPVSTQIDTPKLALDPLSALENLALHTNNITLYSAGLPNFPSNFARDGILSAILMRDPVMLRDQLVFCAILQGSEKNPYTGEEPGKIFHEMPPSKVRGCSTEFNACDTTALFLYGHEVYLQLTNDDQFIVRQKKYLRRAVEYILSHLVNNLFVEDPKFSGSKRFALRVTYWKDSQVPNRQHGLPVYPAVFTLAHVQNMRALKSAAKLLQAHDLFNTANEMRRHLSILFNDKRGIFHSGVDRRGFFPGTTSDNLHMLYYLEPGDITDEKLQRMAEGVKVLETPIGYMTLNTKEEWLQKDITHHDGYHTNAVWPFEQAFIHIAAKKFGLYHIAEVSKRVYKILNSYSELFIKEGELFVKKGSETQLWTIAAKMYFDKVAGIFTDKQTDFRGLAA